MRYIEFCPLIITALTLASALVNLYLYYKKIGSKEHLSFAFLCFFMSFYSIFCHLTYRTTNIETITFWIRYQYAALSTFPFFFLYFIYDYTERKTKKFVWVTSIFGATAAMAFICGVKAIAPAPPKLIHIAWLDYTYQVPRIDTVSEIILTILVIFTVTVGGYGTFLLYKYYRKGNTETFVMLIATIIFYLSGLNDALVDQGVYPFIFLSEYCGSIMIIGMFYALCNKFIKINEEIKTKTLLSAVGMMATEVVHDLSAPISAIKMAVEIAREDGLDKEQQIKYLSFIEIETRRLSGMVFDILQYVKNDEILNIQKIDLMKYMDEIITLIEFQLRNQPVELQYRSEYRGEIHIDPDKFKRVLLNIAINAREGFSQGMDIGEKTRRDSSTGCNTALGNRFSISITKSNGYLHFSFQDNGPGIPVHLWPHLFEPFSSHGKKLGTGLGLGIAKQIVEHHQGKISFESEESTGTVFRIKLPIHAD